MSERAVDMPRTRIASSPHIAANEGVTRIMLWVIAALAPSAVWAVILMDFIERRPGEPYVAIPLLAFGIGTAVATEFVWNRLAGKPQSLWDGTAVVTGLLVAMSLPPRTPWWIVLAASLIAIALGKMIFGGLGWNLFNPALVGRAFVVISWAGVFSELQVPGGWYRGIDVPATGGYDAISGATRLAIAAADRAADGAYGLDMAADYAPLLWRNLSGCLGEVSAGLLLLGGVLLVAKGIIDWRIPVGYLGTMGVFAWAVGSDPFFHVLAGGAMLGAVFMATDYVTSPMTRAGRFAFACGCGLINAVGRFYGPAPEATTWAILFMNGLVPLIDRATRPRTFGWVKRRG